MAETTKISKKNIALSSMLVLSLLFNLAMVYQTRITTTVSDIDYYNNATKIKPFNSYIHVAFFGKYAYRNMKIIRGVGRTFKSILENTIEPIYLHVLLDLMSRERTTRVLRKVARSFHRRLNVSRYLIFLFESANTWQINIIQLF